MNFKMVHNNLNVFDLEKSLNFYKKSLGLNVVKKTEHPKGDFIIVFLGDGITEHNLELTWLKNKTTPYNLGDNEIHLCFQTDNFEEAHNLHEKMGCICFENKEMGLYFISDPDGYWLEILPVKKISV